MPARNFIILHICLVALLSGVSRVARAGETINVAAAISLKDALTTIARQYNADTGDSVEFDFGASGQLMAQIKNGAPVDVFISAADAQVDELEKSGNTVAGSR